jgi:hypothetical protein
MTKYTVIRDELKLRGGGLYAFMPFEKLDGDKKAVFKIGLALDLSNRTENYHTYYPLGVYMVAFLNEIPARKYLRSMKKDMSTKELYLEIEKFIFNTVIRNGGKRLHTTTRVKNQNNKMEGETEWIYCSVNDIHEAFSEAQIKFGGDVNTFDLNSINATAQQSMNSKKKKYIGEIIYFL